MRVAAVGVLLVACGGRPAVRPAAAIANQAPPADAAVEVEPDAAEEDCETSDAVALVEHGVAGEVQLALCTTGETSSSESAREDGFVEKQREARLIWTPRDKDAVTTLLETWTDGWEWGSGFAIAGAVVAPSGEGVLLIRRTSSGPSPGSTGYGAELGAYRLDGDAWKPVGTWSANSVDVAVAKDQRTATIDSCSTAADPAQAAGCGGFDDADPGPTIEISYDGARIVETRQP